MTAAAVLVFVCICVSAVFTAPYDFPENLDIDKVLESDRLTDNYVDCVLDKKACTPEGQKIKDALPEALKDNCAQCTEGNKANIKKVLLHLKSKRPELFAQIAAKYDPNGTYKTQLENFLKN